MGWIITGLGTRTLASGNTDLEMAKLTFIRFKDESVLPATCAQWLTRHLYWNTSPVPSIYVQTLHTNEKLSKATTLYNTIGLHHKSPYVWGSILKECCSDPVIYLPKLKWSSTCWRCSPCYGHWWFYHIVCMGNTNLIFFCIWKVKYNDQ